ncbi:MAG: hypothetical protein GXP25_07105 [Planctomycetes bacterium]|nr:hypothetical protein [Planctomycetota bacterium]
MADDDRKLPSLPRDGEPAGGRVVGAMRGLLGAVAGGVLSYWAFGWLVGQGFYAMVLPGGLIGIGCELASGRKSFFLGTVCAIATIALCLFLEWMYFPFIADQSLMYFLQHLHLLRSMTWILIGLGAALAFWLGMGREARR